MLISGVSSDWDTVNACFSLLTMMVEVALGAKSVWPGIGSSKIWQSHVVVGAIAADIGAGI